MAVYKTILLFSDVDLLMMGLELQNDKATLDCDTYVLDDCWPLNRYANDMALEKLKVRWPRLKVIKAPKNLGIHEGFNYLTKQMPLQDGDILICTAPDSVPLNKGWDDAMVKVHEADDRIAYVGTNSIAIDTTPNVRWVHGVTKDGIKIKIPANTPAMYHSTAFKWDFLKKCGGFHQPLNYYGLLEISMWNRMQHFGMHSAYLSEYSEDFRLEPYHPQIYRDYKIAQAHTKTFKGSFEEYLASL